MVSGLLFFYCDYQSGYYQSFARYKYPQIGYDIVMMILTVANGVFSVLTYEYFSLVWCIFALLAQILTLRYHLGGSRRDEYWEK
jgi:hypothetical protein